MAQFRSPKAEARSSSSMMVATQHCSFRRGFELEGRRRTKRKSANKEEAGRRGSLARFSANCLSLARSSEGVWRRRLLTPHDRRSSSFRIREQLLVPGINVDVRRRIETRSSLQLSAFLVERIDRALDVMLSGGSPFCGWATLAKAAHNAFAPGTHIVIRGVPIDASRIGRLRVTTIEDTLGRGNFQSPRTLT